MNAFEDYHAERSRQRMSQEAVDQAFESVSGSSSQAAKGSVGGAGGVGGLVGGDGLVGKLKKEREGEGGLRGGVGRGGGAEKMAMKDEHATHAGGEGGGEDEGVEEGDNDNADDASGLASGKSGRNGGKLMELYEVQLLVCVLIGLDILFSTLEFVMSYNVTSLSLVPLNLQVGLLRVVQSFTGFTLFFFILELLVLVGTYGGDFFLHVGYLTDLIIVAVCAYGEVDGWGKEVRVLGFVRFWRVVR